MRGLAGQTVSHYHIEEQIGEGGMGVVYKALDTKLQRVVALKFLPSYLSIDNESVARFIQEARAASALDHPNICSIHEIGTNDDATYICMGYYEGESLKQIMDRGPLEIDFVIDIAIQIASGLAKAHEKEIIHRDIKPSNFIITSDGVVKTLDFGIAKTANTYLTTTGNKLGTTAYMSPEQCSGNPLNQATDIWSLGVVIYQMLTGSLPFPGYHDQAIIYSILNTSPVAVRKLNPEIPYDFSKIVDKALLKDPLKRYHSMEELLDDLKSLRKGAPIKTRKNPAVMRIASIIGLALGGILIWAYLNLNQPVTTKIDSLAVLPFTFATADSGYQYLAHGIAERIIYALSPMPDMKVIASSTSFNKINQSEDPDEIARRLNVATILMGKVFTEKDQFIISAELIDGKDNSVIWGKQYVRSRTELLNLQEQIVLEIKEIIYPDWNQNENNLRAELITSDNEAYLKYLQGRFFWNNRQEEDLNRAIELFKQAIGIDSSFALAYTGLADTYNLMGSYNIISMEQSHPKARDLAVQALELEENLAEAHASLGAVLADYYWDWSGASNHFERAIELNPNYATGHQWYAGYLADLGQFEEAFVHALKARELDPMSYSANLIVGMTLFKARRFSEAIEELELLIKKYPNVGPSHIALGIAYVQSGSLKKGISVLERGRMLNPNFVDIVGELGYAYGIDGQTDKAREMLVELEELSKSRNIPSNTMAMAYMGLGDKDQAFNWLQKMVQEQHWMSRWLKVNPAFDPLRNDPRFQLLVEEVGMVGS